MRGPFAVTVKEDFELRLSPKERIAADLFLAAPAGKAPLVILLHGYGNSKKDHAYQAMHLATWGMHSLTVQLPNKGPWFGNGRTLARLVNLIQRRPEVIDRRIDVNKIILVGHSFGGSSVAIALAEGAPAVGGILLDPAGLGKDLQKFLRQIDKPMLLVRADERVSTTRRSGAFYQSIRRNVADVSIGGAAHEDAQFPLEFASRQSGSDGPTEELQITFVSALTAAAFSLAATGKLDYAWASFGDAIEDGRLVDARKK
jgi:pimeloyl-ACP methyl ester carboxylesterase